MDYLEQGNQYFLSGNYQLAKESYLKKIEEEPDNLSACHNLGLTLYHLGDYYNSVEVLNKPADLGSSGSLVSRGAANRAIGRYDEALRDFGKAFMTDPRNADAYSNYGNSLREFCLPDVAVYFCKAAQEIDPTAVTPHMNEAIAHLLNGNLIPGWEKYEHRWNFEHQKGLKPNYEQPEFDGTQDVKDKTILVYSEQGFGDAIQFARYLPMVEQLGAKVIFKARPELLTLLKRNYNSITVSTWQDPLEEFDYHIPLMSLPRIFKTTIDSIPSEVSYIKADPVLRDKWKKILGSKTKNRVGIVWKSVKESWTTQYRRIPLEMLLSLVTDKFQFVALAIDIDDNEREMLEQHGVLLFDKELTSFDETAGLIANLDLVLTVDTAMSHLAGSMGMPTWVMLTRYAVDWRWFLDRNDSPWYPSVKLFRQQGINNWQSVVDAIRPRLDLL